MEYCSGGEIFLQVAQRGRLPEREARRLFRQLVSGVAACHAAGVAHRDLKLENALLGDGAVLKIADFGYSKRMAGDSGPPVSRVGTPSYIAPEVLICGGGGGGGQQEVGYDGRAADVWSLGVFLYVLVVGAYPFEPPVASPSPPAPLPPPPAAAAADGQQSPGQAPDPSPSPPPPPPPQRNVVEVVRRILAAKYGYPPGLSPSAGCADLIARVLVADPHRRLPLEAVRAHPWFLGIRGGGGEGEGDDPLPADVAEDPAMAVARARQREQESGAAEGASRRWQTEDEVREVVAQARGLGREPRGLATATVTVAGGGGK
jgi:serine/threonine-protein kinase SRK2